MARVEVDAIEQVRQEDVIPGIGQVLRDLEEKELATYRHDPEAARKLLSIGESPIDPKLDPSEFAAWMTVSSSILNLDETITKQ